MRTYLGILAVLGLLGGTVVTAPVAFAKSDNAATGIGKNGTPPGKAKKAGESAKAYAPGQKK